VEWVAYFAARAIDTDSALSESHAGTSPPTVVQPPLVALLRFLAVVPFLVRFGGAPFIGVPFVVVLVLVELSSLVQCRVPGAVVPMLLVLVAAPANLLPLVSPAIREFDRIVAAVVGVVVPVVVECCWTSNPISIS
jgi:hypothetical protein